MKTSLPLFALLFAGCFNPDDILPVTGAVASRDGLEGHTVSLYRQAQSSFGPCEQVDLTKPFKQATSDAAGAFGFELFRAQTQNLASQGPFCFVADVRFPSGSRAWTELQGVYDATQLPVLRDWQPEARVGDGGVLVFSPPIPLPDERAALDGSVVDSLVHRVDVVTSDGGLVWRADDLVNVLTLSPEPTPMVPLRVPVVLDEVRLEDFSGVATFQAQLSEYGDAGLDFGGPRFGSRYYSSNLEAGQRLPLAGARVPVSRGVPCPEVATPCPLTDGDLTVVELELRETVSLTLPTAVPLSAAVLRGVETSTPVVLVTLTLEDGGTSSPLPTQLPMTAWYVPTRGLLADGGFDRTFGASFYAALPLDGGAPVKRVTLRFPGGLGRAAEISLFE